MNGGSHLWVTNEQKESLAFRLHFDGYDVWTVNNRGNYYSSYNEDKDYKKDSTYWDFDEEHFGAIDNVAEITYILDVVSKEGWKDNIAAFIGNAEGGE